MYTSEIKNKITAHFHVRLLLATILGIVLGASIVFSSLQIVYHFSSQKSEDFKQMETSTAVPFKRSAPVQLRIPKIKLDASFEAPLGLKEDKTVEVPDSYEKVGWYVHGATPGEKGTAVILGHVDSYKGPAVFYSLPKLQKGDDIFVTREDGTTALFKVDELHRYSQTNFPTEKVYGENDGSVLRLVTCTGTFDRGKQVYSHNLVVYATLVENSK